MNTINQTPSNSNSNSNRGMTGIYMAYPTSPLLKSVCRPRGYKSLVNDQYTKVGIAKISFRSRERRYKSNFDDEVEFVPLAIIGGEELERIEKPVLAAIAKEFEKVSRARQWFHTNNRCRVADIVSTTLRRSNVEFREPSGAE